jgi:hypothetical protein
MTVVPTSSTLLRRIPIPALYRGQPERVNALCACSDAQCTVEVGTLAYAAKYRCTNARLNAILTRIEALTELE